MPVHVWLQCILGNIIAFFFLPLYKWKLHTFFFICFFLHTLICKDPFKSAKSHAPVTSHDFCLFCWIFLKLWIPSTHELQKRIQEGLFWFYLTISIHTYQGDSVFWYQSWILFFLYQMLSYFWTWYVCTVEHQKTC